MASSEPWFGELGKLVFSFDHYLLEGMMISLIRGGFCGPFGRIRKELE